MSELEQAEREYRALSTRLIYEGFDRTIEPEEQRRLDELADRVVRLSAPDFKALAESYAPAA